MKRKILLMMICLAGLAAGFVGTLLAIDSGGRWPFAGATPALPEARSVRKAILTVDALPGKFGGAASAAIAPVQDGMELRSTFDPAPAMTTIDGAAYLNVEGPQIPAIDGRKVTVELDATLPAGVRSQNGELQFVQNGLGQSGWQRFILKSGRQTYRFEYAAPLDNRPESKIDTFWVRSDADGQGRPLIIHAVRLYLE